MSSCYPVIDNDIPFENFFKSQGEVCLLNNVPDALKSDDTNLKYFQTMDDLMFHYGIRTEDIITANENNTPYLGDFVITQQEKKYFIRIYSDIGIRDFFQNNKYATKNDNIVGIVLSCDRFLK